LILHLQRGARHQEKELTIIEPLLYAQHSCKHLSHVTSFNPPNSPESQYSYSLHFADKGMEALEGKENVPRSKH
jgi:hypothetical protein